MRVAAVLIAAGGLAACQAAGDYALGEGDANYDALAKATAECKASGGHVELKAGYDERDLANWFCRMGKAR